MGQGNRAGINNDGDACSAPRAATGRSLGAAARPISCAENPGSSSSARRASGLLIAYDIMEADGKDVRPEPLEERRKRLTKLLSHKTKAMRDGIQLSEAITGDVTAIFRHACWMDLEGIVSKRIGSR